MSQLPEDIEALDVVHYPDPRLREVARPLADPADPLLDRLIARMRELMKQAGGVGLAANQVGLLVRIFIANPTGEAADELVVINPEVLETEGWQETNEGCLSVPGAQCKLRRHKRVKLRFVQPGGQTGVVDATGLLATIFQHESDHLDGRLIVDRVGLIGRLSVRDTLRQLEEEYAG